MPLLVKFGVCFKSYSVLRHLLHESPKHNYLFLRQLSVTHPFFLKEFSTNREYKNKEQRKVRLLIYNCSLYRVARYKQTPKMGDDIDWKNAKSIYDFTVKDSFGKDVELKKYSGYVVLIVNIASQCALTKNNYTKITELKNKYFDKGLRILSFPCNQFANEMPEADGEEMVCHLRDAKADVGDLFKKIDVNGDNAIPLYKYLKHKQTGTLGSGIKWNFTKFLVDKNGQPVDRFGPTTDPMDIAKKVENLL